MKIPQRAKRVFSGVIYDVYQWKEKNFDGTLAIFEAVKRANSVQIIALQGKNVCVGYERQPGMKPFYSLFGGRMDAGEKPLAAAKRELREETGMVSEDWELLEVYEVPGRIEWNLYYYVARNCRVVGKQHLDAGEKIKVVKLSYAAFIKRLKHPAFRGGERVLDLIGRDHRPQDRARFRRRLSRLL